MAITRREAINTATQNGMSRSDAGKNYRSLRKIGRNAGIRGEQNRNMAGAGLVEMAGIQPVEVFQPQGFEEVSQVYPSGALTGVAVSQQAPRGLAVKRTATARPEVLTFQGDFNTAFKNARTMGEKEFYWNGNKYTTDLAPNEQPQKRGLVGKIVDTIVEAGERPNTTDYN